MGCVNTSKYLFWLFVPLKSVRNLQSFPIICEPDPISCPRILSLAPGSLKDSNRRTLLDLDCSPRSTPDLFNLREAWHFRHCCQPLSLSLSLWQPTWCTWSLGWSCGWRMWRGSSMSASTSTSTRSSTGSISARRTSRLTRLVPFLQQEYKFSSRGKFCLPITILQICVCLS